MKKNNRLFALCMAVIWCIVFAAPRLELVRKAGKQYAETGMIDEALLAEIGSPMIPEETYVAIVNGEVQP